MISNKAVLSLGASDRIIPYFEQIKKLGYSIIAFDKNPQTEGMEFVDYFENISTYDFNSCLQALRIYKKRFGSLKIIAMTAGLPVYYAAIIRKKINKENVNLELYKSSVEKHFLRKMLRNVNFSNLRSLKTNSKLEARKFLKKVAICVIKPNLGGMSSNWTIKLSDIKTLDRYFKKICEVSLDNNAYLEEFFSGEEYKVSTIWKEGQFKFFSLEKAIVDQEFPIVCGHAAGVLKNRRISNKLKATLSLLFRKLGFEDGPVGIDIIVSKKRLEILDVEFALTDSHILLPYLSKYDVYKNEISAMFGNRVDLLKPFSEAYCLRRIWAPADKYINISRKSQYRFLKKFVLDNKPKTIISGPFGRYKMKGFFITHGKTQEQAIKRSDRVLIEIKNSFL